MSLPTAGTRHFVYDASGRVMGEYGASASDVQAEFIWLSPEVGAGGPFGGDDGLGGYAPLAVATPDASATIELNWIYADHLGTPLIETDATGALATTPDDYLAPAFPGQSRMFADLYYNRYRDYDPTTGRYIEADPIGLGGGSNDYLYAGANPINATDPTGQWWWLVGAAALGGGDLVYQLYQHDWDIHCVDWWEVGDWALVGTGVGDLAGGALALGRLGLRPLGELLGDEAGSVPSAIKRTPDELEQMIAAAEKQYPLKAGKTELHHITPKYMGGAKDGPLARLNAAYHQVITNEFRVQHPYGGAIPSPQRLREIMEEVYGQFPLPPEF